MTELISSLKPQPIHNRTLSSSSLRSSSSPSPAANENLPGERRTGKAPTRLARNKKPSFDITVYEEDEDEELVLPPTTPIAPPPATRRASLHIADPSLESRVPPSPSLEGDNPRVTVEAATPERRRSSIRTADLIGSNLRDAGWLGEVDAQGNSASRTSLATRRRSPISMNESRLFSWSESAQASPLPTSSTTNPQTHVNMGIRRKIWVRRSHAAATQVTICDDDLVDDVKDMILKKYANSLGRNYDPPDITLKVVGGGRSSRQSSERTLGADENMMTILSLHYPNGQSMEEALVVDVPQRRTPKHSPRVAMPYHLSDDFRPRETSTDYFPPMPLAGPNSPHLPTNLSVSSQQGSIHRPSIHPHSISILETGQIPNLPSPGSRVSWHSGRPKHGRQQTSSPTVLNGGTHDIAKLQIPATAPTPPIPVDLQIHRTNTPPRNSSPRPKPNKRNRRTIDSSPAQTGLLNGAVPPINVLIVEDNIINLKLLEAFCKRLKVRWSTAMNGAIAVQKWREGGFHLVLMDIQLPVMNGLDATKEIRRLERANNISVFSGGAGATPNLSNGITLEGIPQAKKASSEDTFLKMELFKSPVIIVALTASSLQSDRHEALAAGCNDFLTKPVNFDWLSRKVMEWGCMQALIDFDGWRKWKDFQTPLPPPQTPTTTSTTTAAATTSVTATATTATITNTTTTTTTAAAPTAPPSKPPLSNLPSTDSETGNGDGLPLPRRLSTSASVTATEIASVLGVGTPLTRERKVGVNGGVGKGFLVTEGGEGNGSGSGSGSGGEGEVDADADADADGEGSGSEGEVVGVRRWGRGGGSGCDYMVCV